MKLFPARALAIAAVAALLAAIPGKAQSGQTQTPVKPSPANPTPASPNPASSSGQDQPAPQPAEPNGRVLFQRSLDAGGDTVSTTGIAAKPGAQSSNASSLEDADRQAVAVTGLDLDLRLDTAAQQLAARALVTVRNTGTAPLSRIPLQISSSLNWERVRIAGRDATSPVATINSDSDHTGQLHEAAIALPTPLAPGETLELDVTYSGTITATARRLVSVGTPEDSASHSDWDQISPAFTGLRGFGNVAWYPVVSLPVIIGDGARLFDEIGRQKLRSVGTEFRLRLTVEFPQGQAPTVALVNGNAVPLKIADPQNPNPDLPGIASSDTGPTTLTFESPSLFVTTEPAHQGTHLTVYTVPEDEVSSENLAARPPTTSRP